jgi:LacI family transcriptional regulator
LQGFGGFLWNECRLQARIAVIRVAAVTKKQQSTVPGAATIRDVAERAGVSIKTVSRVINGEPYVSATTAARVQSAAKALSYRPRLSARSLAGQRSREIALWHGVIGSGISTYYTTTENRFVSACREADFGPILDPLDPHSPRLIEQAMASLGERRPAGVIMTPPLSDNEELLAHLDDRGIDFVCVSPVRETADRSFATTDDFAAGREMTEHLIGLGHRRIAFVTGLPDHGATARRMEGFLAAHREHDIPVDSELVVPGRQSFESGASAGRMLLTLPEPPTAIFAANDDMAVGVVHVAHDMNIRIPEEISIAGFDDTPIARYIYPCISTVRQPIGEMIGAAVSYLVEHVRDKDGTPPEPLAARFPCSLVIRDSTARAAV